MSKRVFVFPLNNTLTLLNVGLPLHIFEPRYREMVIDAIETDTPIAVTQIEHEGNYQGRAVVAGVPELLQKYPDGRMDIVIRGDQKLCLTKFLFESPYKVFEGEELTEDMHLSDQGEFALECVSTALSTWAAKQITDHIQLMNFRHAITDPVTLVSYATLFMIDSPKEKQRLLAEHKFEQKVDRLLRLIAPKEIDLGPFLAPLKF